MLLIGGVLPSLSPQNLTVATTGASGAIFCRQLLLAVARDERVQTVDFIASDSALRVMAEELGITGRSKLIEQLLGTASENSSVGRAARKIASNKIKLQSNAD